MTGITSQKETLTFDIEFLKTKFINYSVEINRANKNVNNTVLLADLCCEHQKVTPNIHIHGNHKTLILIFFLEHMKYSELLKDEKYCNYLDQHYLKSIGEKATIDSFSTLCKEYIKQLFDSKLGKSYLALDRNVKNQVYATSAIWYSFYQNENTTTENSVNINVDIAKATKGIKYAEAIVPMLLAMTNNYQVNENKTQH